MVSAWLFRVTFFVAHESISLAAIPRYLSAGRGGRSALPRCASSLPLTPDGPCGPWLCEGGASLFALSLVTSARYLSAGAGGRSALPRFARSLSETVKESRRSASDD